MMLTNAGQQMLTRLLANQSVVLQVAVAGRAALEPFRHHFSTADYRALTAHGDALASLDGGIVIGRESVSSTSGAQGAPSGSTTTTPTLTNIKPFLQQNAPYESSVNAELFLRDNQSIYWWMTGDPYATNSSGSSGYFLNVVDTAESSILPNNPSHPLPPVGSDTIGAQLNAPGAPFGLPTEAQLFLTDPAYLARYLLSGEDGHMVTKSAHIADVFGGPFTDDADNCSIITGQGLAPEEAMPGAVSLIAPANTILQGFTPTTIEDLQESSFGGAPPGPNEIRAVKLQNPGLCTYEVAFAPLYNGTSSGKSGLRDILKSAIANLCSKTAIRGAGINYLFGTPVIGRDDANIPTSQFFLNLDLSVELSALQLGFGCNLRASALYDVVASDGRVTFQLNPANRHIDAYHGGGCDDINFPTFLLYVPALLLGSGLEVEALSALAQGAGWVDFDGPNTLVREVLLDKFLRQELNQIIRSQTGIPFGDYGTFISSRLGASSTVFQNSTCDPTLPDVGEHVETGLDDVPGDRHLLSSTYPSAMTTMCRMVRDGFSQTHAPNGPPMTLQLDPSANPFINPCLTLVSTPNLWFQYKGQIGPTTANTDEQALELMFQAISELDENGNLKHWGCPTPCDPSENKNMSLEIVVDSGRAQLQNDPTIAAVFNPSGCKSTLSSILGGSKLASTTFGRFLGSQSGKPNDSPADPTKSLVTFYPPIRRIILNPDGIEVVFIDNENDWTNAALAARYALSGLDRLINAAKPPVQPISPTKLLLSPEVQSLGPAPGSSLVAQLCNYTRPDSPTFTRAWATLRYPAQQSDPDAFIVDSSISCGGPSRACVPNCPLGFVPICYAIDRSCGCVPDPNNPHGGWYNNPTYHPCADDSDCTTLPAQPHCTNGLCSP